MALETDSRNSEPAMATERGTRRSGRALLAAFGKSHTTWVVCMVFLLALLPRLLSAGHFTTYDEPVWRRRSSNFIDAVTSGNFSDASALGNGSKATMPGVTTMWIGGIARGVWSVGRSLNLWSSDETLFRDSPAGLAVAQVLMAIVVSALVGLLVFLVAKWTGSLTAGAIAGVFLATEPYLVTLGAVLHTDELMSLFGVAALVATALLLGLPRATSWQGRWWAASLAGALFGGALLTKLSALPFLAGVAAMGGWALIRHLRSLPRAAPGKPADNDNTEAELDPKTIAKVGAIWAAAAATVFVVLYPAMWADPIGEVGHLRESAAMAGEGHGHFFLGERTNTPGPTYLFVTIPLRTTPWFLIAGIVAGIAILWRRSLRAYGVLAICMALPTFAIISLASKQSVRYALPVPIIGAIVIGIVGAAVMAHFSRVPSPRLPISWLAAAALAVVTVHTVAVAPWGNAYFNPLLGGSSTAERAHTIGSGEGLEIAGDFIQERESGRCEEVLIWTYPVSDSFPCGRVTNYNQRHGGADYVVLYINQRQRQPPEFIEKLTADRELLDTVTVRGILYAEIFGPRISDDS